MSHSLLAHYEKNYSYINGFQPALTITYTARNSPDGIVLSLTEHKDNTDTTEEFTAKISPETAHNVILFLGENGLKLYNWLDVLEDMGVYSA